MGYYTKFKVEVTGTKDEKESVYLCYLLKIIVMYNIYNEKIRENSFSFDIEEAKWYEYDEECTKFSKDHPHITINVHGKGEESGDVWKARYRNGDSERITLPEELPPFTKLV